MVITLATSGDAGSAILRGVGAALLTELLRPLLARLVALPGPKDPQDQL